MSIFAILSRYIILRLTKPPPRLRRERLLPLKAHHRKPWNKSRKMRAPLSNLRFELWWARDTTIHLTNSTTTQVDSLVLLVYLARVACNCQLPSSRRFRSPDSRPAEMAVPGGGAAAALALTLLLRSCVSAAAHGSPSALRHAVPRVAAGGGLCEQLLLPLGYPCTEHTVETNDGFLLSLQHIPRGKNGVADSTRPPVFLQHGLFQGGDTWFINSAEQSLGYILADNGFDVWIGNVRGTRWSKGHSTFTVHDKLFWDWSWQELAESDLQAMLTYVYTVRQSKILYVGHSQGTIMGLAAFTFPEIAKMINAAALLCPISYLDHVSASFVLRAVGMHLDQMLLTMGIHQLNFRSDMGVQIVDSLCDDGHVDCNDLLSSITGENCCFNGSRIDYYLEYEPHPSSTKNLRHLFQMIRKGTFARYDYGLLGNLRRYGRLSPPPFDLSSIPESLPMWMGYGGLDALADVTDVDRTVKELRSTPELLYIGGYGHIDFVMSVKAKDDVYVDLMRFLNLRSNGSLHSSS